MRWKHSLTLFALIAALALLSQAALAQDGAPVPAPGGQAARIDQPTIQPDTALGALASIGCGIFVRASIVTAANTGRLMERSDSTMVVTRSSSGMKSSHHPLSQPSGSCPADQG